MSLKRGVIVRNIDTDMELLARHVNILKVVMKNQPIGIIKLSELTKLPEHKVRYSLRILEREGLLVPSANGAMTSPRVREFLGELDGMLDRFKGTVDSLRAGLK
jgi:predicted transcriptional regulator